MDMNENSSSVGDQSKIRQVPKNYTSQMTGYKLLGNLRHETS